jgi:hypothetical protein
MRPLCGDRDQKLSSVLLSFLVNFKIAGQTDVDSDLGLLVLIDGLISGRHSQHGHRLLMAYMCVSEPSSECFVILSLNDSRQRPSYYL